MALVVADRVKETTSTAGTGAVSLAGAELTFVTFSSVMSDGDTTYYTIVDNTNSEFEVGLGTYASSGNTLTRTTIFSSSNSNNAVNFQAGPKDVFLTYPADKSVRLDANGKIAENQTFAGTVTLNADPSSGLQAATKQYVDDTAAEGIQYHSPVRVEKEGNLSATYDNGTAGVGATLTNNSTQAALVIDGITLSVNDRVLVYEQTDQTENGIYTVTNTGSASTNWVLTRATDADSYAPSDPNALAQGSGFFVQEGTAGAGEKYVCNTVGTITFGTTNITFVQVSTAQIYTAGTGINVSGSVISSDATLDEVTTSGATTSNAITVGNLTSTGIDDNASSTAITIASGGETTFGGDVILSESTPILKFLDTDVTDSFFNLQFTGAQMYMRSRGGTSDYGDVRFQRTNDGSTYLNVFRTTTGGDVLFYDDDGSTEGLRWDASTSRLGLSDSTPATMLQVGNNSTEDSNAYITFGKRVASTESNLPFIGQDDYDGGSHSDLGLGARSTNGTINFYTGNVAAFTAANRRMSIEANGDVTIANDVDISGNLIAGDGTNISMGTLSPGQLRIDGNGYAGAIALDATAMHIYHNSSVRDIVFGTNETEQMRLDTNGDLGVGSDNPLARLHVKLTAGTTGETDPLARFERFTTGDNHYLDIGVDNANNLVSFKSTGSSDGGFKFENVGNGDLVSIDSAGDSIFYGQITQVTAGTGINASVHTGMGIKGSTPRLTMEPTADSQSSRIQFTNTAGTLWGSIFAYNDTERIQITAGKVNFNTDKVAIGTTDAAYHLHVHEAGDGGAWAMFSNNTTGSSAGNGALVGLDGAEEFNIRNYENTAIDFWTNNTQRMRIANDGNIGINTGSSAPQKELQINLASTTTTTVGSKGGIEFYAASSTVGNGGEITWISGSGTTERWCAISGHITTNTVDGSIGDIVFATKSTTTATSLTERMRVYGSGGVSVSGSSGDMLTLIDTNLTASSSDIGNVRIAWNDSAGTRVAYVGSVNSNEFWINNSYANVVLSFAGSRMFETVSGGAKLYGKLNITDNDYDNHIELNRNSEQWRISPSTDGSLDIRRIAGTGTAALDIQSDTNITGSVTTEGPDGGMVMRYWPGYTSYGMIGTANMASGEYALLTDGTNTFVAGGSGGNTYIRNGANDTTPQLVVYPASIDVEGGPLNVNQTLTVGDGSSTASHIAIKPADDADADDLQFYNGTTRMGEIGTQDTTWLRINQETAKNIYTPRYIRADGGFFVDGTAKGINGSGNFIGGTVTTPSLTAEVASGPAIYIKDTSGTGATNHNSWISFRDSANTELGYVGYGSGSTTYLSVSNYGNGPVQLGGTAIIMSATVQITDANTTISEGTGNALRFSTNSGYVDVGPMNTSYSHFQTDRSKFYFNAPTHVDGGVVDYDLQKYYVLPDASYNTQASASTARHAGLINYLYNQATISLTRGDFGHHIITQWSQNLNLTISDSSWVQGDIIDIHTMRNANTVTVNASRIYTQTGSHDTQVTFNYERGTLRFQKYSTNSGYWMVSVI